MSTSCDTQFSHAIQGKGQIQERNTLGKGHFPFIAWANCMSQGIENRGSLIGVPLVDKTVSATSPLNGTLIDLDMLKNTCRGLCPVFATSQNAFSWARHVAQDFPDALVFFFVGNFGDSPKIPPSKKLASRVSIIANPRRGG